MGNTCMRCPKQPGLLYSRTGGPRRSARKTGSEPQNRKQVPPPPPTSKKEHPPGRWVFCVFANMAEPACQRNFPPPDPVPPSGSQLGVSHLPSLKWEPPSSGFLIDPFFVFCSRYPVLGARVVLLVVTQLAHGKMCNSQLEVLTVPMATTAIWR